MLSYASSTPHCHVLAYANGNEAVILGYNWFVSVWKGLDQFPDRKENSCINVRKRNIYLHSEMVVVCANDSHC